MYLFRAAKYTTFAFFQRLASNSFCENVEIFAMYLSFAGHVRREFPDIRKYVICDNIELLLTIFTGS